MPKPPKFKSGPTEAHKILAGTKGIVDKILHKYDKIKHRNRKAKVKIEVIELIEEGDDVSESK